jgi:hypothetical protein
MEFDVTNKILLYTDGNFFKFYPLFYKSSIWFLQTKIINLIVDEEQRILIIGIIQFIYIFKYTETELNQYSIY